MLGTMHAYLLKISKAHYTSPHAYWDLNKYLHKQGVTDHIPARDEILQRSVCHNVMHVHVFICNTSLIPSDGRTGTYGE